MVFMYYLVSLCLIFLSSFSLYAQTVTLLSDDIKDIDILQKVGINDIASDTNRLLFNNINDIEFELEVAPAARIDALLKEDRTLCAINRIRTEERLRYHLYSYPVHLYPSHRLYYFKNKTPISNALLTKQNELISINALMEHYPLSIIGIESGRSYGKLLDAQFAQLKEKNLLMRAGSDAYKAMINLFERQRVDFLVTYPTNFKDYAEKENDNISSISIANHPVFIAGHIACSNTSTSRKVIKRINQILLKLYPTENFLSMHLNHVPQADQNLVRRRISDLFLKYKFSGVN